jgi:hypothetical protein
MERYLYSPYICPHNMSMDNLTFISEIYPHTIVTVVPICLKENPHITYKNVLFFLLLIYSKPRNVSVLTHISIFQLTFYTGVLISL